MPSILFLNNDISSPLKNKKKLRNSFIKIFNNEDVILKNICFIFSTDEALLKLNRKFLKHDTFTDILTFSLSETNLPINSDIYISLERVKENAKQLNISYLKELHRVMIHGILHLCGFSDHTPSMKAIMRKKENFYLNELGFT